MAGGDDLAGGSGGSGSGRRPQIVDRSAFGGSDLVGCHLFATGDDLARVGFGLGHDRGGFGAGMLKHGGRVLFRIGDPGGIFGTQGFGFGAQRLGIVQLAADRGDLVVETLGDRAGHLLPHQDQQEDEHGSRDDRAGANAVNGGFGRLVATGVLFDGCRRFRHVSHGRSPAPRRVPHRPKPKDPPGG
jgi:hypothetical protein